MLYVQQSLGPDEELVHVGRFHWMYTAGALLYIVWGALCAIIVIVGALYFYRWLGRIPPDMGAIEAIRALHPGLRVAAFLMFMLGVFGFALRMVNKATTEIAVTTARIVFKRGLVARYVGEINIDRIEGVNILQNLPGRIFNYGRVAVRGMGIGEVVLPPIEDPIAFRQAIERARSL